MLANDKIQSLTVQKKEKNQKKTIFLVGNPTQYINAIEFIKRGICDGSYVLVIASVYVPAINILREDVFPEVKWDEVIIFDYSKMGIMKFDESRRISDQMLSIIKNNNFDAIVVSNLGDAFFYSILIRIRKDMPIKCCYALDDGSPSIAILQARRDKEFYKRFHVSGARRLLRMALRFKVFLPIHKPVTPIFFFSSYDIVPREPDKLIINDYSFLRNKYLKKCKSDTSAVIIGQNVVEKGIMTESDYIGILEFVISYFYLNGVDTVIYLMHRGEERRKFESTRKKMQIIQPQIPIEVSLLTFDRIPLYVCGFFSSALLNMVPIIPEFFKLISFHIPCQLISGTELESKDTILNVYRQIRRHSRIEIIDCEIK